MSNCFLFHKYEWVNSANPSNCYRKCSKCGKVQELSYSPHVFQKTGCSTVCIRCGFVKKTEHSFVDVNGKCLRRCTVCGKEEPMGHRMKGRQINGHCEQYCTRCGFTINGHMWWNDDFFGSYYIGDHYVEPAGCKCSVCGELNPNGKHKWQKTVEGDFADIKICTVCGARDESEKITLEEASIRKAIADAERDEAMRREDSMSEMRSVGIKC